MPNISKPPTDADRQKAQDGALELPDTRKESDGGSISSYGGIGLKAGLLGASLDADAAGEHLSFAALGLAGRQNVSNPNDFIYGVGGGFAVRLGPIQAELSGILGINEHGEIAVEGTGEVETRFAGSATKGVRLH